jgi:hypothetical protein
LLFALGFCACGGPSSEGSQDTPADLEPSNADLSFGATWPIPNGVGLGLTNEKNYRLLSEDVVLDEVTGLAWQRRPVTEFFDWMAAQGYCNALVLGGFSDWRLPSRMELVSLVSFETLDPSIDLVTFPDTLSDWFWTSTPSVLNAEQAWYVYFYFGYPNQDIQTFEFSVRCVRSESNSASRVRYLLSEAVVFDQYTGLTWQRHASDELYSLPAARAYCEDLELADAADWRAPTLPELESIVDAGRADPAIEPSVFPDTAPEEFWSSTPWTEAPDLRGWYVDFHDGSALYLIGTTEQHVRCAR